MGGLVETEIAESMEGLVTGDMELCEKVRRDDAKVDALEVRIDELAVRVLALRQPVASDLRTIVCALRISSNLERIGDYSKNIAKRAMLIDGDAKVGSSANTLKRMARMVKTMVG
ncbi:MAG: phosphate transport system regulatory protein PhoU, partial [Rhodobiaceae bacterium]|nr:phosphate transport system regulatory protein PhoU [Rhodobiaceae bacterium]